MRQSKLPLTFRRATPVVILYSLNAIFSFRMECPFSISFKTAQQSTTSRRTFFKVARYKGTISIPAY